MAAIAVAVLFVTHTGIAQAARLLLPLPPVVIGYETTEVKPGPSEYPGITPTPSPVQPRPEASPTPVPVPPQPIQPLD